MTKRREGKIRKEVLDEVLKDYSTPEDLLGKNGIMAELKQRLIEAAMEAEMEDHLAYVKNGKRAEGSDNCRNGFSSKKVISNTGQIDIQIPRDREGNYDPLIFFGCIVVKSREDVKASNRSVYLALAINMEGKKEILGFWIAPAEGAKFWLGVMTELKNRGVKDLFIASIDGLKSLSEAIETVFPEVKCIVHMIRNSIKYVNWEDRKEVCKDIKEVYSAATESGALRKLEESGQKWDSKYPAIRKKWVNNWDRVIPFLDYPEDIRKAMYTTNAIESINRSIRKVIKAKWAFPNDRAIFKILYLALNNASKEWTMPIKTEKPPLTFLQLNSKDGFWNE